MTAVDEVELDPRLCRLDGHGGDARKLLAYMFAKQNSFYQSSDILADACARCHASVDDIPEFMVDRFVWIMRREPFAWRILTLQLCEPDTMTPMKDAAEFLEKFFARFPD